MKQVPIVDVTDPRPQPQLALVSVVVPALDEAENLVHVLPRIPQWVDEVILVDDHCTDDTVAVAKRLLPTIRVVTNNRAPGKGSALLSGFEAATGDIIVQLDADGSAAPEEISLFVIALLAGADYAKGSRFMEGGGTTDITRVRQSGNWALVQLVKLTFGGRFTDLCHGYNAFWKDILPGLQLDAVGFEIEAMFNVRALKAGLAISEVPTFEAARISGDGKLVTWPDGWRVLRTIVRERASFRRLERTGGGDRPRQPEMS